MKKIIVYHGTSYLFDEIDLNKSKDKRDFGKGFYTTTIVSQAEAWARNISIRNGCECGYVYVYEFAFDSSLKIKEFLGLNEEWLDFIKLNRVQGGVQHNFDVVIGPVANDNTMLTVNRYINGVYDAEEALKRLAYFKVNDQVCLNTAKALEFIKLQRRHKVDL
ncbi:MAG: DUF3990 domain-containing protein [Phascolarctobacterium sp.]|nr:DUF3990 domain-containing protein [Phascolarctobacterium sp.]